MADNPSPDPEPSDGEALDALADYLADREAHRIPADHLADPPPALLTPEDVAGMTERYRPPSPDDDVYVGVDPACDEDGDPATAIVRRTADGRIHLDPPPTLGHRLAETAGRLEGTIAAGSAAFAGMVPGYRSALTAAMRAEEAELRHRVATLDARRAAEDRLAGATIRHEQAQTAKLRWLAALLTNIGVGCVAPMVGYFVGRSFGWTLAGAGVSVGSAVAHVVVFQGTHLAATIAATSTAAELAEAQAVADGLGRTILGGRS